MKTETNKATHTPGPWNVQDNTAEPYGQLLVDSAEYGAVAICYTMERGETVAPAECLQNARLISAAPELLEALDRLVEYLQGYDLDYPEATPIFDKARAAIDKATGSSMV